MEASNSLITIPNKKIYLSDLVKVVWSISLFNKENRSTDVYTKSREVFLELKDIVSWLGLSDYIFYHCRERSVSNEELNRYFYFSGFPSLIEVRSQNYHPLACLSYIWNYVLKQQLDLETVSDPKLWPIPVLIGTNHIQFSKRYFNHCNGMALRWIAGQQFILDLSKKCRNEGKIFDIKQWKYSGRWTC